MKCITVNKNEAGQRLDKLLSKYLNLAGKGFLYKMMRKKNIVLNGKKCDVHAAPVPLKLCTVGYKTPLSEG